MKTKSKTIKTLKIELQEKIAFLNDNLHLLEDLDDNLTVTCDSAEELLRGILANKLVKTFKTPANLEKLESIRTPAEYGFMLCNEFCIKRTRERDTDDVIRVFVEAVSPAEWFNIRIKILYDGLSNLEQDLAKRHKNSSMYKHILMQVQRVRNDIENTKMMQTKTLEPCYFLQY